MNAETVDARAELRKPVETGLTRPPVVALQPVLAQVTDVAEADALRPVVHCLRIRPARPAQPLPQVGEVGFGDLYAKRDDLRTHRGNLSVVMQRGEPSLECAVPGGVVSVSAQVVTQQQLIPGRQGTGLDNMRMVRSGAGRAAAVQKAG